jgi:hypothetical protein
MNDATRTTDMHAVVTSLTFNDRAAAEAELPAIVSRVSDMPGFVGGYWVALSADQGTSIIVFDSQEAAQTLANFAQDAPYASVTPRAIQVGEVMAHAMRASTDADQANPGQPEGRNR